MTQYIKSAIVIGATGLVGRALVKQLSELQHCEKITVVVRKTDAELNPLAKVEQYQLSDLLLLNHEDVAGYSHAFSCLGTTLKQAGSKEKFYDTDFGINVHFAELLKNSATHLVLVSAMGANTQSKFFYNRVKGELEDYIRSLQLEKTSIIRPSLLLGQRSEPRLLEDISQKIYQRLAAFIPDRFQYKPVTAFQVAHTMVEAAQTQNNNFEIYDNLFIQKTK